MKKIALTLSAMVVATVSSYAQISFTGLYSQDFDGLTNTGSTSLLTSAGIGAQVAIPGLAGWSATRNAGTGATLNLVADTGAANSGAVYSYGASGSTERSLGSLASGSNSPTVGFSLTNNTGGTITSLNLSFTGEFWRSSTSTQNTLTFFYGVSTDGITGTDYLTSGTMASNSAFDLVGPAPVTTNGALDGNDPANQVLVSGVLSGLNWAPGETLFIRWTDTNDLGSDAGLAIDNLSLSAVPEPGTVALIAMGLGALLLIRRRTVAIK